MQLIEVLEVLDSFEPDVPDADAAVRANRDDLLLLLVDRDRKDLRVRVRLDRLYNALSVRVDDHHLALDAASRHYR